MTARLPATRLPGAIPTMNARGFMLEALDEFAEEFIRAAAAGGGESLDIGCAYGVATIAALERGARMCACDMEPRRREGEGARALRARGAAVQRCAIATVVTSRMPARARASRAAARRRFHSTPSVASRRPADGRA